MADEITDTTETTENPKKVEGWFNQLGFTWILVIASTVVFIATIFFMPSSGEQTAPLQDLALKLQNKSLVLILAVLYSTYWRSTNFNVDKFIWRSPIAVAIYMGCTFIALALA